MSKCDTVQIIRNDAGEAAFVVLPVAEYERLRGGHGGHGGHGDGGGGDVDDEDGALIALGNAHRHDEAFPADVASRLIDGEVPLKVFRSWRNLTQTELAHQAGLSPMYVSQIERGAREVGKDAARALGKALGVSPEAIMDL